MSTRRKKVKAQARYEVRQDMDGDVESTLVDSAEQAEILQSADEAYKELSTLIVDVWTLPRTAAAYDALVEQLATAAANYTGPDGFDGMVRAQLRSANITRPPA